MKSQGKVAGCSKSRLIRGVKRRKQEDLFLSTASAQRLACLQWLVPRWFLKPREGRKTRHNRNRGFPQHSFRLTYMGNVKIHVINFFRIRRNACLIA